MAGGGWRMGGDGEGESVWGTKVEESKLALRRKASELGFKHAIVGDGADMSMCQARHPKCGEES